MSKADQDDSSVDDNLIMEDNNDSDPDFGKIADNIDVRPKASRRRLTKSKKQHVNRREEVDDEDGPDDAGKERPDDQEYNAEDDRIHDDEADHEIIDTDPVFEQKEAPKQKQSPMPRQGRTKRGHADSSIIQVTTV